MWVVSHYWPGERHPPVSCLLATVSNSRLFHLHDFVVFTRRSDLKKDNGQIEPSVGLSAKPIPTKASRTEPAKHDLWGLRGPRQLRRNRSAEVKLDSQSSRAMTEENIGRLIGARSGRYCKCLDRVGTSTSVDVTKRLHRATRGELPGTRSPFSRQVTSALFFSLTVVSATSSPTSSAVHIRHNMVLVSNVSDRATDCDSAGLVSNWPSSSVILNG